MKKNTKGGLVETSLAGHELLLLAGRSLDDG